MVCILPKCILLGPFFTWYTDEVVRQLRIERLPTLVAVCILTCIFTTEEGPSEADWYSIKNGENVYIWLLLQRTQVAKTVATTHSMEQGDFSLDQRPKLCHCVCLRGHSWLLRERDVIAAIWCSSPTAAINVLYIAVVLARAL